MNTPYEIAFADATRRAASGLRTAAGVDPEKEAAPLVAILRSSGALDAEGLELLARLVTGDLRKVKSRPGESFLAQAVRRAGTAWRRGKRHDPATTGAALAEALRGDPARLGRGERAWVADLVSGELRRGENRPGKGAGNAHVAAPVAAFRGLIANGVVRKVAVEDTARQFKLTPRTIETYLAMTIEQERAADT